MRKKINKALYWAPRILSIMFILFLMLFSLDVFGQGYGFWGTLLAFLMHNIPVFILTIIIIIAWKHEIVGAVAFILAGALYIARTVFTAITTPPFQWYYLSWSLIIAGPAILTGILFLLCWKKRKND